ncbi:LysR family transcriptional regulator [Rhodococcus erythropolis]|uniref:LysR family transcriptional regulator n=1 Tax=Rhodococcus erythropolis TaxID=1833 RepID=UPI001BE67CA3|nr:LysR family transcriptional regulator [Rhodococcus erythropolis]MBT2266067.1 LysR family transcriptional regulator [Rhodococcus erythropolis]
MHRDRLLAAFLLRHAILKSMLELRWLESFVAVVDQGGFLQAGANLRLSQPTVSGHVKDLEKALGQLLVDRRSRPVQMTPAGEKFVRHARLILSEVDASLVAVGRYSELTTKVVTIGTYPSASAGYLPSVLRHTQQRCPEIEVVLEEMAGGEMERAAESGRLDIFLRQSEPPLSPQRFGQELLWREAFLVVVPQDHPWATETDQLLDPQQLLRTRMIMTGRFQPESLLGHPLWQDLGGYPELAHRVQHPQSLLALVEAGAGIGLTTELPVAVSRKYDVVVRRIDHLSAVREVFVNWSRARPLTDQAKTIVELMMAHPIPPPMRRDRSSRSRHIYGGQE